MKTTYKNSVCAYKSMCIYKVKYSSFDWIFHPKCYGHAAVTCMSTYEPCMRSYKTFFVLNSTETKFQLLIKDNILTNKEVSCFKSLRCCINHANKC